MQITPAESSYDVWIDDMRQYDSEIGVCSVETITNSRSRLRESELNSFQKYSNTELESIANLSYVSVPC